jgi:hypothetical protein
VIIAIVAGFLMLPPIDPGLPTIPPPLPTYITHGDGTRTECAPDFSTCDWDYNRG